MFPSSKTRSQELLWRHHHAYGLHFPQSLAKTCAWVTPMAHSETSGGGCPEHRGVRGMERQPNQQQGSRDALPWEMFEILDLKLVVL
ncbi:hypothetical protein J6590_036359 [Homalodisca vitripennis]|nr:hypothetical protein J6590_036359 [Homalodisca vitripennis]